MDKQEILRRLEEESRRARRAREDAGYRRNAIAEAVVDQRCETLAFVIRLIEGSGGGLSSLDSYT